MYRMVNRAITQFIKITYGQEIWERVVSKANIQDDIIIIEQYPGGASLKLVGALSEITTRTTSQILISIGEYWLELIYKSEYGELLNGVGDTLPELLSSLDDIHTQANPSSEELVPLSFWISDLTEDSLILHYASDQDGLAPLVVGLVRALSKKLDTECSIIQVGFRGDMVDHDEFAVAFEKVEVKDLFQRSRRTVV